MTIGSPGSIGRRQAMHSSIDILSVVGQYARQTGGPTATGAVPREAAITRDGVDRVQRDGGPLGPGLDEGKVVMVRKSRSAGIVLRTSVWVGLVVLIAGCSVPVLRTPSFVSAPTYDSPQCEDARRLDAQAATWWLPSSCFKPVSR
jgi:hypothetical protein